MLLAIVLFIWKLFEILFDFRPPKDPAPAGVIPFALLDLPAAIAIAVPSWYGHQFTIGPRRFTPDSLKMGMAFSLKGWREH